VRVGAVVALVAAAAAFVAAGGPGYAWQLTPTGADARFRGVSAVSEDVAWVSGTKGTVMRTIDGGATWESVGPPDTHTLQFRDIEAFDADHAVIMGIGSRPGRFRFYVTDDGGRHWDLGYRNAEPAAFYDCMTFFDRDHGLAVSDPINGQFRLLETTDGGHTWNILRPDIPPALPGEFMFAASGQCLVDAGDGNAWIGTGGGPVSRVLRTRDGGQTWTASETPIPSGATSGIFALAFRDARHGLAVGGDFNAPTTAPDSLALTNDGGQTWELVADAPNEYRSGADWITDRHAVVVGPTGSDVSLDKGQTWQPIDEGSFDTVDCTADGACWAAGEQGRAARLVRDR
jgi:photosystem II stability/assembly factor-like uncharacterized protein